MNRSSDLNRDVSGRRPESRLPRWRGLVSCLAFFAAGTALGAWWFLRASAPAPAAPESAGSPALSAATTAVLQRLASPVEIRFYSLLDPAGTPDGIQAFSERVDQLLALYEQAAPGKIKVSRSRVFSTAGANAALADGIKPFNLDKGEGCYLGIAVVRSSQKESLSPLAPEWEQALEPDLTRAIARAVGTEAQPANAPKPDTDTLAAVKRVIPNLDSISLEDGTKALSQSAMTDFKQAVEEMQAKVKIAEDHFIQAEAAQSEAGQEAARKELDQIQADHLANLRRLSAASQAQLATLRQVKGSLY